MTGDQGFELHPGAAQDISEIWQFIAEDNSVAAALLGSRPLRFQTIRDYLIAYAPEEKPLVVIAVIHGRRNPRIMAAILRGRE